MNFFPGNLVQLADKRTAVNVWSTSDDGDWSISYVMLPADVALVVATGQGVDVVGQSWLCILVGGRLGYTRGYGLRK